MKSVTIFLTDPDAASYPFPYQIGDRLKSPTKNIQGTVRNAKFAGQQVAVPSGSPTAWNPLTAIWLWINSANIQYSEKIPDNQWIDNMKTNHREQSVVASAADRFFRAYEAHCVGPDVDTMFNLLNALHSFNDKLRRVCNANLFNLKEFVALKALRNLFHHEDELRSEIRVVAAQDLPPISTDLLFLCLVPRVLVEKAIRGIEKKRRKRDEPLVRNALKWYGNVVKEQRTGSHLNY